MKVYYTSSKLILIIKAPVFRVPVHVGFVLCEGVREIGPGLGRVQALNL